MILIVLVLLWLLAVLVMHVGPFIAAALIVVGFWLGAIAYADSVKK